MDEFIANNQIIVWVVGVVAGLIYLARTIRQNSADENRALADARGKRIDDLEEDIERRDQQWQQKCNQFEVRIAEVEGEIKQLTQLKTDEIKTGVIEGVRDILLELHEEA